MEASQQRERLLGTVLDTAAVGVVAVDADGNDLLMNAAQSVLHGHAVPANVADPEEKELLVFAADS